MSRLVQKAGQIMTLAHGNQKRKTDDSPYIVHPLMVAKKLSKHNFSDEIIAAALVHDVLEDTDYPAKKLKKELGEEVYNMVQAVSEDKRLKWEDRKMKYIKTIKNSSEGAKAVAIADKIHNLESLLKAHSILGKKVWEKFNRGKDKKIWFEGEMLKMFKASWSHPLIKEYEKLFNQAKKLD